MKVGFLQIFNEVAWAPFAIDQALKICDKLFICEGSQFANFKDIPVYSDDGTVDVIREKMADNPRSVFLLENCRRSQNYRTNQCENFNNAIAWCNNGDYLLPLDADEFYTDEYLEEINSTLLEGRIDALITSTKLFAFSFNWELDFGVQSTKEVAFKVNDRLYFTPTHQPHNIGLNVRHDKQFGMHHYSWMKPKDRMAIRMRTSGMYPNMQNWFKANWDKIELKDGPFATYKGVANLKKFDWPHPSILDNHPWRNIKDIRRIG